MARIEEFNTASGGRVVLNERSLSEYAAVFDKPINPANPWENDCKQFGLGQDWTGDITSLTQARALVDSGWQAGADRLAKLAREVEPPTAKPRKRVARWSDDGSDLDVDRAMRGDDQSWRTTRRQWSAGPAVIDLITVFGGNCSVSSDQLFWSGAACVVLADVLEAAGYGVRILGTFTIKANSGAGHVMTNVVMKDESEPMRIDALASVLCHAGTFRTHGFRSLCSQPMAVGRNLGYPIDKWKGHHNGNLTEIAEACGYPAGSSIRLNQSLSLDACKREIAAALAAIESLQS